MKKEEFTLAHLKTKIRLITARILVRVLVWIIETSYDRPIILKDTCLEEGTKKKDGVNKKPTCLSPSPPKGQGGRKTWIDGKLLEGELNKRLTSAEKRGPTSKTWGEVIDTIQKDSSEKKKPAKKPNKEGTKNGTKRSKTRKN